MGLTLDTPTPKLASSARDSSTPKLASSARGVYSLLGALRDLQQAHYPFKLKETGHMANRDVREATEAGCGRENEYVTSGRGMLPVRKAKWRLGQFLCIIREELRQLNSMCLLGFAS